MTSTKKRIKSSSHSTKFMNKGKLDLLSDFLDEYNKGVEFYINYWWSNRVETKLSNGKILIFDLSKCMYDIPSMLNIANIYPKDSPLSKRVLMIASSEAIGIIKSVTTKIKKLYYRLNKSTDDKIKESIQKKIDNIKFSKPIRSKRARANLNSKCCDFFPGISKEFDGFLVLKSIGKKYGKIAIPIKFHKHSDGLKKRGWALKTSWLVDLKQVCSTWEKEPTPIKEEGKRIGADQGITTCLSLSDEQITPKCNHGHDLSSIMKTMKNKKPGSKAYERCQSHRKDYINWSIKQLDFSNVKTLALEEVKDIRKGKRLNGFMNRWTYPLIEAAIVNRCEDEGVLLLKQSPTYRSQRCSVCGYVHETNRKNKKFKCGSCGFVMDADINGAKNHEPELFPLPKNFHLLKLNKSGFYWTSDGIYDLMGQALAVPDANKSI